MKYVIGILFLLAAAVHGRSLWRWIQEGESDIIMSVGGDGIFGRRTKRSDEPFQFWFHITLNGLIIAAFAVASLWFFVGSAGF